MPRLTTSSLAVVLMVVLCLAVCAPVAVFQVQRTPVTHGPWWLWWLVFTAFLLAFVAAMILSGHPRRRLALVFFWCQAVLAAALVLLITDGVGFVPVILVLGAALSAYLLPRWGSAVLIVVNSVIVWVAVAGGDGLLEPLVTGMFYILIQAVSVISVVLLERESAARRQLVEAHVDLAAAGALLAASARAEERVRISRDLHDVMGHQLTAMALELEVASHQADGPARDHVLRARGVAKELLSDVRSAVSDLRDDGVDLKSSIERVVADVPAPKIHVQIDDAPVGPAQTTALVRAVQEAVTNTIRHAAEAENLWIVIETENGATVLQAWDDGWGAHEPHPGNGWRGIAERAGHLGGSAQFSRGDNGGILVRMELPT